MKNAKIILSIFAAIIICISSIFFVSAESSTIDEAIISQADDRYVPLYTKSPDSSLKNHSASEFSSKDYQLFYTQTTLLALIAGYLILFKVKGLHNKKK